MNIWCSGLLTMRHRLLPNARIWRVHFPITPTEFLPSFPVSLALSKRRFCEDSFVFSLVFCLSTTVFTVGQRKLIQKLEWPGFRLLYQIPFAVIFTSIHQQLGILSYVCRFRLYCLLRYRWLRLLPSLTSEQKRLPSPFY